MKIFQQLTGEQRSAAKRREGFLQRRSYRQFMHRRRLLAVATLGISLWSLNSCRSDVDPGDFTTDEIALIRMYSSETFSQGQGNGIKNGNTTAGVNDSDVPAGTMRVLTIEDSCDNAVLRDTSRNLSVKALLSEEYAELTKLMLATVTHPSQDGVGIAGPQVGLNRRVVAVQRFDKEGEPFEVYPNISIVWASDSLASGPEGCLSVPDRRADVLRSREIVIEYADIQAIRSAECGQSTASEMSGSRSIANEPKTRRDTVCGFTAVIFQHEIDHLDGILYIDRL